MTHCNNLRLPVFQMKKDWENMRAFYLIIFTPYLDMYKTISSVGQAQAH